jgi:glycosyltransferase involved in cell wall biosynthesis
MGKAKLSVLLSAYNAAEYIGEAIESILNQTFGDFELLIADDGSADQTKEIIESFCSDARVRASHNVTNQGKTNTINRLFGLSKGQYITIHDADDFSAKTRFEEQINFLDNNSEYGVCGTAFISIDKNGDVFSKTIMKQSHSQIIDDIDNQSQIHGPTAVIRRIYVDALGEIYRSYFENNFEDIDFLYRILTQSKAYNLPEYLYYYRILADSLCRKEVTVKNRNLYKVVLRLTKQRLSNGKDDLEKGEVDKVSDFLDEITVQYRNDPSMIHREGAAYYLYWKLYKKAIISSIRSVIINPLKFKNYNTLQYCIRKSIFR